MRFISQCAAALIQQLWMVPFQVNVDFQDEKWKTLLNEVGITKQQLNQKSTREFIYDFVQKQGGIEEVTKKIQNERPQGIQAHITFEYILIVQTFIQFDCN